MDTATLVLPTYSFQPFFVDALTYLGEDRFENPFRDNGRGEVLVDGQLSMPPDFRLKRVNVIPFVRDDIVTRNTRDNKTQFRLRCHIPFGCFPSWRKDEIRVGIELSPS